MGNNDKKIITISREFGSGGRLIGKRLAEKLDVPFYDKQLLDRIAEESGFSKEMIKDAEMKAKNSFLYSLASAMGTSESGPESLSLNERFFLAQFDTIRRIADDGSCVIVGRCSDYVLRGMPESSHIFVYAEEKDKIKRAVQEYGVPEDEVRKLMKDTDKARANYYAYHTGRKWGEHVNYSLSIDSGYIEIEDIVDLIVQYTKVRRFSQAYPQDLSCKDPCPAVSASSRSCCKDDAGRQPEERRQHEHQSYVFQRHRHYEKGDRRHRRPACKSSGGGEPSGERNPGGSCRE